MRIKFLYMEAILRKRYWWLVALSLSGILVVGLWWSHLPVMAEGSLSLRPPALVDPQTAVIPSAAFLVDEAGITAYAHLSQTIRLDYVDSEFRTLELQTDEYLIGSVPVPGYSIEYDAHVYVHRDGWMVAYYPPSKPVSWMLDWRNRRIMPTNLERVLQVLANKDGLTLPDVNYYDFRYPNATHMLWVRKNSGTMKINIPASFEIDERSWVMGANYTYGGASASFILDGVTLARFTYSINSWQCAHGVLTEEQLLPDLMHTIKVPTQNVSNFSALTLVYRDSNAAY